MMKVASIILLLILFCLLLLHAGYYMPFIADDALISLRYADRLLEGKGLTWTDSSRVEGYSNFLWIISVSLLGATGLGLITASRILGILGMTGVILILLFFYQPRYKYGEKWFSPMTGILFFCLSAPVAVWAIGGLEQPFIALFLTSSFLIAFSIAGSNIVSVRKLMVLSLLLGLISLLRLDGPIFAFTFFSSFLTMKYFWRQDWALRNLFLLVTLPVLLYGGQILFRLAYYGELVPNTALVKITPSSHHFYNGLQYILKGIWALSPLSILAVILLTLIMFFPEKRNRALVLLLAFLAWAAYLIFIGGDIFPAFRHFIPFIIVFALALIEGLDLIESKLRESSHPRLATAVRTIVIVSFIPFLCLQFTGHQYLRAINERWEWDGKDLGLLLNSAFSDKQPEIAVTAAGCIPYWSKLPAIDMMGLNDRYIPRHRPKDIGSGTIGHELGDGLYILQREPDIIIFNIGSAPAFRCGSELAAIPDFKRLYSPVRVLVRSSPELIITLYFRKYGGKIGLRQSDSEIDIPGYLLNRNPETVAILSDDHNLTLTLSGNQSTGILMDSVVNKDWDVKIEGVNTESIDVVIESHDSTLNLNLTNMGKGAAEIERVKLKTKSPLRQGYEIGL